MNKKGNDVKDLILLAKGHTRGKCPFDGAEVWGVNDVGSFPEFKGKKIDRLFTFDPRAKNFLKEMKDVAPITSWRDYADVQYPLDEIIKHFGISYFTNTISYMLALAIYEGFTRIRMYGVDAPYGGIYFMEKSGLEYWVGRAQERGVEVIPCKDSAVLRTHDNEIYGKREGDGLISLFLSERMGLMNLLPAFGDYDTIYRSGLVRWLVGLKDRERKEHKVTVGASIEGTIVYKCDHEFSADILFPEWVMSYLRDRLEYLEKNKQLPIHVISVYEKLMKLNLPEPIGDVKKKVRVSYVITTKNRAKFLKATFGNIKKILTEKDELIVIDGNSTDGTSKVIEENADIIDIMLSEDDSTAAEALNKGILLSHGKYIKHYPDDDIILSLEGQVEYMEEHSEIDLLVAGGTKRWPNKQGQVVAPTNYGHAFRDIFIYGACGTGFLYRKNSFSRIGLPDPEHRVPDQEYALRCIEKGVIKFFPGNNYLHTIYPHSTSRFDGEQIMKQHNALMKKYCGKMFLCKRKLHTFLMKAPLIKGLYRERWLRRVEAKR